MTDRSEILFVDPYTPDLGTIRAGLREGVDAIVLDAARPAARQIAEALEGRRDLAAVHVIAHGASGRVSFAAGEWSAASVGGDAADLAAIGRALAENGTLSLWSCDTAAGPAGKTFIESLARRTGADVAASTGRVGAAGRGGAWDLGVRAGRPTPKPPLTDAGVEAYAGVLAAHYWIVSGQVPREDVENVKYVVVGKDLVVVNTFFLPGRTDIKTFSITVNLPSDEDIYEVGRLDARGNFQRSDFSLSRTSLLNTGAPGAQGVRHEA